MTRIISTILTFFAAFVVVIVAVANRHGVVLSLDPFSIDDPAIALELPLYVVLFGGIALGLLVGGFAAWAGGHASRKLLRQRGKALLSEARGVSSKDVHTSETEKRPGRQSGKALSAPKE